MPRDALVERLAAADPIPDAEHLTPEDQREADELLARLVATSPGHGRTLRLRGRRPALVAAGVGVAAVLTFAVINVADLGAPGTGVEPAVAARAVAATARADSIYHVIALRRGSSSLTGVPDIRAYVEAWYASDGRMHEKAYEAVGRARGELREETAGRRPGAILRYDVAENRLHGGGIGRSSDDAPALDPGADPGATLRSLQDQGRLRTAGTTELGGRAAFRLVSGPIDSESGGTQHLEYLVDAETYLPLRLTWSEEGFEHVTDFLVYERLPLDDAGREQLDLDAPRDATCEPGAEQSTDLGFRNPCAGQDP